MRHPISVSRASRSFSFLSERMALRDAGYCNCRSGQMWYWNTAGINEQIALSIYQ